MDLLDYHLAINSKNYQLYLSLMEKDYPPENKMLPLNITLPTGDFISHSPRDIWLSLDSLRKIEEKYLLECYQKS